MFDTCALQSQDPVCRVSPSVGADVLPITMRGEKEGVESLKLPGPCFQVLSASSLACSENGLHQVTLNGVNKAALI